MRTVGTQPKVCGDFKRVKSLVYRKSDDLNHLRRIKKIYRDFMEVKCRCYVKTGGLRRVSLESFVQTSKFTSTLWNLQSSYFKFEETDHITRKQ